jgi:hypothetical protein
VSSAPSGLLKRGQYGRGDAASDAHYLRFVAALVSISAFLYFLRHQEILLYGDATAHINIARRVFDSRTPGPLQLGTVWLPLPHILIIPFVVARGMWSSGVGASLPSMVACVAGAVGIFRLVHGALEEPAEARPAFAAVAARGTAWCAALIFVLNPNLLYLQATAMTEPLYLALFIWATVFFRDFVQAARAQSQAGERSRLALVRCGWLLLAAMLTRYDGWFAAATFAVAGFAVLFPSKAGPGRFWRSPQRPVFLQFVLILAIAPVAWFAYNAILWGNPLEFATGPYSAPAIEARAPRPGGWHHPGWQSPKTAAIYFMKAAKLNMAGGQPQRETEQAAKWRLENFWFPLALVGTALVLVFARRLWPWLLLWLPLPFYALSVAWGGVPIFVPVWWPYSYYNTRYGLELLPALAAFAAVPVFFLARNRGWKALLLAVLALLALTGASYVVSWRARPVTVREAHANNDRRVAFDRAVAAALQRMPPGASVLMSVANHAAALQFAEFPLRRTINETNNRLWRAELADPGARTDYVIAFESADDPVWRAVREHGGKLQTLEIISALDQPRAVIYAGKSH